MRSRAPAIAVAALVAALLGGCSIQPWVKPYERERLADPIMQFAGDPLIDKHRDHVYTVREGARGGERGEAGAQGERAHRHSLSSPRICASYSVSTPSR